MAGFKRTLYLDESGDLGFGTEGSSRFLVIGYIATGDPEGLQRAVKKLKERLHVRRDSELKANSSPPAVRYAVLQRLATLPIEVRCAVVRKELVWPNLRLTPNVLYNYLAKTVILPFVKVYGPVRLIYDRRSAKVAGPLLSFEDYLRTEAWGAGCTQDAIAIEGWASHLHFGLCAVDFVLHAVFRFYEAAEGRERNIILPRITNEFRIWEAQ